MKPERLPTYFLSHGGGPWPWLDGQFRRAFDRLEESLKGVIEDAGRVPAAVLMVTGHWETPRFEVSSAARPGMVYDYSGFPEHTYHITYAAPGDPALAARVAGLLDAAGLDARADDSRGFDHGSFSLMQAMRPQADIPVVQLSIRDDMDAAAHIRAGHALACLRDEDVLILGSGLSFHNLSLFRAAEASLPSARFDAWLQDALVSHRAEEREARLRDWAQAPMARVAHPREDHLLPLMVAAGAARDEAGACIYHQTDFMGSVTASNFRFG